MDKKIDIEKIGDQLACLKKDCLACRKCPIGGKNLDGSDWSQEDWECYRIPVSNVFSNMVANSSLMVVGQNPGLDEVAQGEPFVGHAGMIFDELLINKVGLKREQIYVTNTVKCYTSGRKPKSFEVSNCQYILDKEIEILKPKVILAIGSFAFKALTGMSGITKNCGEVVVSPRYLTPVVAMLHPSANVMCDDDRKEMVHKAMETLKEEIFKK